MGGNKEKVSTSKMTFNAPKEFHSYERFFMHSFFAVWLKFDFVTP